MIIYLYKKTHIITGLKYLGKTTVVGPHNYKGSGKYWKAHIKSHGYDVTTEILKECTSNEEIKYWGKYYSELWNIVESDEWANLKPEDGDGGAQHMTHDYKLKISNSSKGRKFTDEHRNNLSKSGRGRIDTRTLETKLLAAQKASKSLKGKKKPEGFGEKIRQANLGKTRPNSAKQNMKKSWTNERRKKQALRAKILNSLKSTVSCKFCNEQ